MPGNKTLELDEEKLQNIKNVLMKEEENGRLSPCQ